MKTLDEEKENSEMNNGIKEERLRALRGNYQKPDFLKFPLNEKGMSECSDMGSCIGDVEITPEMAHCIFWNEVS